MPTVIIDGHSCPSILGNDSLFSEDVHQLGNSTITLDPYVCEMSIEGGTHVQLELVQGRLKQNAAFWQYGASALVVGIVTEGYHLPFLVEPAPSSQGNHPSVLEHASFVDTAIAELLWARCVVQCSSCPTVCSPLIVVANSHRKLRLVIDLRHINGFLKFKYEGLSQVAQMFRILYHF